MLFASPHSGFRLAFTCVICFQSPIVPAQTSGGAAKLSRTTTEIFPSLASDMYGTNPPRARVSAPVHTGAALPAESSRVTNVCPSLIPVAKTPPDPATHESEVAVHFTSGVKFFIAPPLAALE